ncbi:hypothetical protein [Nocardioides montaniterrae]
MSFLSSYLVSSRNTRLENFERTMRRREGSRARAARTRRRLSEESWR